MSDMTREQVQALHARINEINCELQSLSQTAGANILQRNAAKRNAEHEHSSAILRQELAELRAKLPPEGMATGQRLVMARTLGETFLRDDPEPDYADVNTPVDEWDWSEA